MTDHPCKEMSPYARRDFDRIAMGKLPLGHHNTISQLLAAGLIEPYERGWVIPGRPLTQWSRYAAELLLRRERRRMT